MDQASVKSLVSACHQHAKNQTESNTRHLIKTIDGLIEVTSNRQNLKLFSPKQLVSSEGLSRLVDILNENSSCSDLIHKTLVLLSNLTLDDDICDALQRQYDLPSTLAAFLCAHVRKTADDLIISQCIELLQKLTYSYKITYINSSLEEYVRFLISTVLQPESSLTLPCLGLLANICRHNNIIQAQISAMENFRSINKALMSHLSHRNQTVVVYALSILTSLCVNGELNDKLFHARNIGQTFRLVFNLLMNSDQSSVIPAYTVNLFQDLLRHSKVQDHLSRFQHLSEGLHQVLAVLSNLDYESAAKILELLQTLLDIQSIRNVVMKVFLHRGQQTSPRSTPHLAVLIKWGQEPVTRSGKTSIVALDVLKELYQEMIESGNLEHSTIPHDALMQALLHMLTAPNLTAEGSLVNRECKKVSAAIQLLHVLCGNEYLCSALIKSLDSSILSVIVEHQLIHNEVASLGRRTAIDSEWSESGINLVIHTLDFMDTLKSVQTVKDSLNNLIQDDRIIPFLSCALTSQNQEVVLKTIKLIGVASSLPAFQTKLLGESIAAQNFQQQEEAKTASLYAPRQPYHMSYGKGGGDDKGFISVCDVTSTVEFGTSASSRVSDVSVERLINKIKTGMDLKEIHASDIMDVYEHKLSALQTKESHLQDLLEAKALALSQADRLIKQYRCQRAQSEAEARKLRSLLQESERLNEDYNQQLQEASVQHHRLQKELEDMTSQNKRLEEIAKDRDQLTILHSEQTERLNSTQRSLATTKQELCAVNEMNSMLKRHNETLKSQFEEAASSFEEKISKKEKRLGEVEQKLESESQKLQLTTKQRDELQERMGKLEVEYQKVKKELTQQVSDLQVQRDQNEAAIKEKDALIEMQREQLGKVTQITNMIHQMTKQ